MRLTTRSRYGTRMVMDIAKHEHQGPVRLLDTAKREELSVSYLEVLIRQLRKAGFIKSVRGPKGGHMLNVNAESITLFDIVEILEGDTHLVDCEKSPHLCHRRETCVTRCVWRDMEQTIRSKLSALTIKDLLLMEEESRSANREGMCPP